MNLQKPECNILLLLLQISLLILIGCKNNESTKKNDSQNNEKKETTKLRWLAHWKGEGKKEQLVYEIAREFSLLNQDIELEIEFPHDMLKISYDENFFSGTVDSIAQMAVTNQWPYDVMLCGIYIHQAIANKIGDNDWAKKELIDFQNEPWFINAHKTYLFSTDRYTQPYGNIAPGAYIEGLWNILYKSKVVEQKLGLEIKETDMKFSDFLSYAKAVFDYNQTHNDKITFFSTQRVTAVKLLFTHLVMSILGKENADNYEEAVDVLQKAYASFEKLALFKPLKQYIAVNDEFSLHEDKNLFILYPSYINMFWQKNNPEGEKKMFPCEMPSFGEEQASVYSGTYQAIFVVPKNAKNKEAAMRFMKFISSKDVADQWVKYSGCPTGLKNTLSYGDFGNSAFSAFSRHISEKYHDQFAENEIITSLFNYPGEVELHLEDVLNGTISAQEAFNSVLEEIR